MTGVWNLSKQVGLAVLGVQESVAHFRARQELLQMVHTIAPPPPLRLFSHLWWSSFNFILFESSWKKMKRTPRLCACAVVITLETQKCQKREPRSVEFNFFINCDRRKRFFAKICLTDKGHVCLKLFQNKTSWHCCGIVGSEGGSWVHRVVHLSLTKCRSTSRRPEK